MNTSIIKEYKYIQTTITLLIELNQPAAGAQAANYLHTHNHRLQIRLNPSTARNLAFPLISNNYYYRECVDQSNAQRL